MQEPQRRHRAIEFVSEEIGFKAKVAREGAMQSRAERGAGFVIGERRFAKPRQLRPGVERAEWLARHQLRIVWREVKSDVEGLLHIRSSRRVERLMQKTGIAAIAADRLDRELPLVGNGQREELCDCAKASAISSLSTPWLTT